MNYFAILYVKFLSALVNLLQWATASFENMMISILILAIVLWIANHPSRRKY